MFPDGFYEYFNNQHQKIKTNFDLASQYFDVEGIHGLRVEIKRLRAFFDLIEAINPNFHAQQNLKKIRKLFKAAGALRDLHIAQAAIRKWTQALNLNLSEYYNFLVQRERVVRLEFSATCKKFNFGVFKKNGEHISNLIQYLPADYAQYKTQQQFDRSIAQLIEFRSKTDLAAEDYHKIRILTKAARYTLEILQLCFVTDEQLNQLNGALQEVHQALGRWHDDEIVMQTFEAFTTENGATSRFDQHSYQIFPKKLQQGKTRLLRTFETKWAAFMAILEANSKLTEQIMIKNSAAT
jgi:CHAD domain-containing protein